MFGKRGLIYLVLVLMIVPLADSAQRSASIVEDDDYIPPTQSSFNCIDGTEIGSCNSQNKFCGNDNLLQNSGFERGNDLPFNYKKDPNAILNQDVFYSNDAYSGEKSIKITNKW